MALNNLHSQIHYEQGRITLKHSVLPEYVTLNQTLQSPMTSLRSVASFAILMAMMETSQARAASDLLF